MKESKILYPSPVLSQYIKYYWVLKTDVVEPVMVQIIPSGCVHLVFHRGENLNIQSKGLQPKNFIRGQFSTYGSLISEGNIDMIAVIFHPLGLNPFVRCSMREKESKILYPSPVLSQYIKYYWALKTDEVEPV